MDRAAGAMRDEVTAALAALGAGAPLREGATGLLGALGWRSRRTARAGSVAEFLERLDSTAALTDRQRALFRPWKAVEILFQITDAEIDGRPGLFDRLEGFDRGRARSFLFLAAELEAGPQPRARLADAARAVNRRFPMPVVLLFRHGPDLTLAAVHRRAHKRDSERDVLEKATLIKDIRAAAPHRAHVEILADLALPALLARGARDFDGLHAAWERVLDIEALNRRFYRELFGWFRRAAAACRFPDDGAGEGSAERHVIRLVTRLLFVWFLKEKGLVPDRLFTQEFAREALRDPSPDGSDYYRAVLQNLFFATLNTEIDNRAFSARNPAGHRDFNKYRYRAMLADPDGFAQTLRSVPFVNGGLFDCLDDFDAAGEGGRRIDAFTDNPAQGAGLSAPGRLFLDPDEGLFPLFRRYKFTVEENTPLDREVALDPELLGRAFENLLAAYNPETRETARKATGSYYTPRRVVDYMVGEALAQALTAKMEPGDGDDAGFLRERLGYLLDWEDACDDAADLFDEAETRRLLRAVAELRVLDPAAGSGAFPMGVLQTLTLALRRLDPENRRWEALQKDLALTRAGAALDARDEAERTAELAEIGKVFAAWRDSDFGRKLYLIQNVLYGVDIQPIACQIARLRFFISLVIEQEAGGGPADNHGVRPLPNLETRFVAADALIGIGGERQGALRSEAARTLEERLRRVRERHFSARVRADKIALAREDRALRAELARELERLGFALADARRIAEWDPYDPNARAGWFDPEWMFGVTDGFDATIGNPPYIQLQKDGGRLARAYRNAGYETFAAAGDIHALFHERGCRLLRAGAGVLAFVASNSWLKAEYGRPLRRWLAERHSPLALIEMGKDVFDAHVDVAILTVREGGGPAAPLPAVDMDRLGADGEGGAAAFPPPARLWGEARPAGEAPWSVLGAAEWSALERMKAAGTPLKDWDVRIAYGIKTGLNEAFILDDAERDALVARDPRSAEILKPVLRGRDIRRWRARWAGKWMIDAHNGWTDGPVRIPPVDLDDYPAVKARLARWLPALQRRRDKGATPFNLRDCAYHEDFKREKLFWIELVDRGRFAWDDSGSFGEATVFMLTGECLKFLCAILNSKPTHWFLRHTAPTSGMGVIRWKKVYVEAVPIPRVPPEEQAPFARLVDRILAAKAADPDADASAEEAEIDRRACALYNLSPPEIAAIEAALPP